MARAWATPRIGTLKSTHADVYEASKAAKPSGFLFLEPVTGLDGTKLAEAQAAKDKTPAQKALSESSIVGDRLTLKADSFIPAAMAVIYLLLLIYFKSIGGYRPLTISDQR